MNDATANFVARHIAFIIASAIVVGIGAVLTLVTGGAVEPRVIFALAAVNYIGMNLGHKVGMHEGKEEAKLEG